MKHVIYIYTTKSAKKDGWFKVGYTSIDADSRIKQQDNESNFEKLEKVFDIDITDAWNDKIRRFPELEGRLPDKMIHRELRLEGFPEREDKSREWFQTGTIDHIQKAIQKVVHEDVLRTSFQPSFFQELVIRKFMDAIENSETDQYLGLAELCARFGKTKTFLELFRRINAKYGNDVLILPAYVLTVFPSFSKEIDDTTQFKDMIFIDSRDDDYAKSISKHIGNKLIVIGVSLHSENMERLSPIKNIDNSRKFLVIDEADFGAHTDKSRGVLSNIM